MQNQNVFPLRYAWAALLALVSPTRAHSWIEYAYKIAPNGTFAGDVGYPRGYLPRTSTNPLWNDFIPESLLPTQGESAFTGQELLNKFTLDKKPPYAMLEASPGDYIALMHYENGHVTLPDIQPTKPQNRGTIYLYGTSQPKEHEKLFDVHLIWNDDGTGGDGRGKLLATRNFDDGQCFQPNYGAISDARAAEYASEGAEESEELLCQSDLKLPSDLKAGSIYTIYWYWDWPDLNPEYINLNATTNGLYPWAGTFMRGEKDPNGFTMNAISRNESYSSTIDIKITGAGTNEGFAFNDKTSTGHQWIADQNIYSKAVKDQIGSNYQVNVKPDVSGSATAKAAGGSTATSDKGVATVTVTHLVPQTTLVKTVFQTVVASAEPTPDSSSSTSSPSSSTSLSTSTVDPTSTLMVTRTTYIPTTAQSSSLQTDTSTANEDSLATGRPSVSPFMQAKRFRWALGAI